MSKIFLLSCPLFVFLFSCTTVYFDRAQPRDGKPLNEFPDEILNEWILNENLGSFSILFTLNSMVLTEYEKDTLSNEMFLKKRTEISIGDSIILKDCKSFYALSLKENKNQYQVVSLVFNEIEEIEIYTPQHVPFWKNSRKLKLDSVVVSEGDMFGNNLHVQDNFKLKEGEGIRKVHYSGSLKIKHLKKMNREENLLLILRSDGTIEFQ